MGNRRLGARRLAAVQKRGQTGVDASLQAGEGMKNAVVSHRIRQEGSIIVTEIHLDLQGRPGSGHVFFSPDTNDDIIGATTYVPVSTDNAATQETNALAATVADASVMTWDNSVHGRIFEAEVLVLEAVTDGDADKSSRIDFSFATKGASDALGTALDNVALRLVQDANALVAGDRYILPLGDDAETGVAVSGEVTPAGKLADIDGKALYLSVPAEDAPGVQYTTGQFLITLKGYLTTAGF